VIAIVDARIDLALGIDVAGLVAVIKVVGTKPGLATQASDTDDGIALSVARSSELTGTGVGDPLKVGMLCATRQVEVLRCVN
jgi:hypothetical protein